ncbi:MAG: tryptophan synthase subunit alpha [Betaproteobacteria bacterium]
MTACEVPTAVAFAAAAAKSHAAHTSRIDACFASLKARSRKGLIPYIAAGDPSAALSVPLMHALVAAGADVIELGVPFSDPMADGPAIQRATGRAILRGVGLAECLGMVAGFRRNDARTPVVLMGYANPIERFGRSAFAQAAGQAGVDGVLVVDYPPEEAGEFASELIAQGLDPIFLLAPTTTEARIGAICAQARGYVYYVSLRGTTGAGHLDIEQVAQRMPIIRRHTELPIGVGFGIRDAQSACAVARVADAVVIGTRLVEELEHANEGQELHAAAGLIASIRAGLDALGKQGASPA